MHDEFGDMAGVNMPNWAIERAVGRRGTAHPFKDLNPAGTALVITGLQLGDMLERGDHMVCTAAREIVPGVNRMAQGMREAGGLVVWVENTQDESRLWGMSLSIQQAMNFAASNARGTATMAPSTPGPVSWPEPDIRPGDETIFKRRYSAFFPGACDVGPMLRERGIDTVIIAGTLTNVCCDTSARDAMMLDFRTIMLSDGCAATSPEEHDAALAAFYATFGDVMDIDFALAMLTVRQGLAA